MRSLAITILGFLGGASGKKICLPRNRSPGGGHGNPLQCSCLENSMDRGAWWATVYRAAKSQTGLRRRHPGHRLGRGEGHAWSRCPVLRFGHSSTSSSLCRPALRPFPRLRQPPTTHPATPDHCPLALQPTCLDSSSSARSGGRARLKLGSSRHMEMAVERTRAVCPPTHRTHKRRQEALALHARGRGLEKPRGQRLHLGLGVGGLRRVFSAVPLTTAYTIAKHSVTDRLFQNKWQQVEKSFNSNTELQDKFPQEPG